MNSGRESVKTVDSDFVNIEIEADKNQYWWEDKCA